MKGLTEEVVPIGIGIVPPESIIFFKAMGEGEMLRIAVDGFYVRGVKLDQDESEARKVYEAFIEWMREIKIIACPLP
jgi:hypothetical protein